MAWTPISGTVPQYQKSDGTLASDYYIKFYSSGTTTAFSMATDSTGGTTLAKAKINSSGYPVSGSGDVFIPHVDQKYKIVLYKNATDADNDTTANADWVVDAVPQSASTSTETAKKQWLTGSDASGQVFSISEFTPSSDTTRVYQNGQGPLKEGASSDYTISGSSITINSGITINTGDSWLFENIPATIVASANSSSVTFDPVAGSSTTVQTELRKHAIWEPSDATGAANMATELETYITDNPGRVVEIKTGSTILLEGFGTGFVTIPTVIHIVAKGVTILQNASSRCVDINNAVNASAEYSCTTVIDEDTLHSNKSKTTKIVLTSSPSALAHDFIAVYSNDGYTGKSGTEMGEIAQLIKDEQASNTLYTSGQLSLTAQFTDANTKVRILDKTRSFVWEGGTFSANGDSDDLAVTTREEAVRIIGYVDPIFRDVTFDKPWSQTVWFQCTAGGIMEDIRVNDVLNNAGSSGFSYGPYLYGMNFGAVVSNIKVRNGRHPGFTTDGDSSPGSWYEKGYPTKNIISNVYGFNCYGSLIDTHEEGADNTFINCYLFNAYDDERAIFEASLAQSRAIRDTFINCHSKYTNRGIKIDNINHGIENTITIRDCSFENIQNNSGNATAIEIDDQGAAGRQRIESSNLSFKDCDRGIDVGEYVEFVYKDIKMYGVDVCWLPRGGSVVFGSDLFCDFSNTTYGSGGLSYVWFVYCDEADTYVTCLGDNVIIKGGNSVPREFFSAAGADTNIRYVYHPGFTDCKSIDSTAAYTATASKLGTFTNLTDTATVAL